MTGTMMRRRDLARVAAVLLLTACGLPAAQEGAVLQPGATPVQDEWRFGSREHVSAWYHALAFTLPGLDSLPVPIYSRTARNEAIAAARRAGINRTPVERAADSLAAEFAGSSRYDQLQFLPLYFDNAEALFNAIRLWEQVEGAPQRAGSQQAAEAVAILSNMFTTARQRLWVARFARAVQEERDAYYLEWFRQREAALRPLADSARTEWLRLQPKLRPLMQHLQVRGGEVLLTPSLAAEGRTVTTRALLRSAVGSAAAQDVVHEVLHELMYSLVGDVVTEHVTPATLRDIGQDVVTSRAAIRAGALVLERLAPERAPAYRRLYLAASGRSGSSADAFRTAFPLPGDLERGLAQRVQEALAGI